MGTNTTIDLPNSTPTEPYFYRIRAFNEHGFSAYSSVIQATPPIDSCDNQVNIAYSRAALASSIEAVELVPFLAVDGNMDTRWSSQYSDPEWLSIDFGTIREICKIAIYWEVAFAQDYDIQVSNDGENWETIRSISNNLNPFNLWLDLNVRSRYLRIYGNNRATPYGYSIWELEVYGKIALPYHINSLSIFPNPSHSELNVVFEIPTNQPVEFELLDPLGRRMVQWNTSALIGLNKSSVSIQNIPTGTYFLKTKIREEEQVSKVLIRH